MDGLPSLNDPVVLHDHTGRGFTSRVENDPEPGVLTVAQPMQPDEFDTAADLELSWVGPRGVGSVPVAVLEAYEQGPIPVWDVESLGEPSFVQRREHVRVHHRAEIAIVVPDGPSGAAQVPGELVDVGEAALRCWVGDPGVDAQLVEGLRLRTRFPVGEVEFCRDGWIHARRPARKRRPHGPPDIIVTFDQSADEADALRREIFAQQLLRRRAGRRS